MFTESFLPVGHPSRIDEHLSGVGDLRAGFKISGASVV